MTESLRPLDPLVGLGSALEYRAADGQTFLPVGVGRRSQPFVLGPRGHNQYRAGPAKSSPSPVFVRFQAKDGFYIFKWFHFKGLYKYLQNISLLPDGEKPKIFTPWPLKKKLVNFWYVVKDISVDPPVR